LLTLSAQGLPGGPLRELARRRNCRSRRISSWDRTGGNDDRLHIFPGETKTLAEIGGAGCITHIWLTAMCSEKHFLRKAVLRMYWDEETVPSVEVPLGDFFGLGHARTKNFSSQPLTMGPQDGRGFNCFFPMPFAAGARLEVTSDCSEAELFLYYYVDYEAYTSLPPDMLQFHAWWNRENPCRGTGDGQESNEAFLFEGINQSGNDNYLILDASGKGHYVGCHLDIENLRETDEFNWYGEGDDMIFIDGEPFPLSLHGTGTEDYFGTAFCPIQEFSSPYHGIILPGESNWAGKITLYRYHIEDPIVFDQSIRVTIEHGHANKRSDDYASTAYWYQAEPHRRFAPLPPAGKRLPRE